MATLTVLTPNFNGVALGAVSASGGGDEFPNDGRSVLYIKNGGGSPINLTITPSGTIGGLSYQTIVAAISAGAERIFGPFPTQQFNNANGRVPLSYSGVTSVTVAVIQVP